MSSEKQLTLRELTKIALGTSKFTKVNLSILHALIDLILKKLNCADETVSIFGFEARCLQEILATAKICPIPFGDDKIEIVADKIARLEELEKRVTSLDAKLEQHLQQITTAMKFEDLRRRISIFDLNPSGCEDLCTVCNPDNEIACKLLGNVDFLKKLLRRLSGPMIERIFRYEKDLEKLDTELTAFIERVKEQYEKIQIIDGCILEVEAVKQEVREHEYRYIATMEEIQDMLDGKLDKMHIPELKRYIRECLDKIDGRLKNLESRQSCTKASGVIMDVHCVSCGMKKVCADRGAEPISILPDFIPCKPHTVPATTLNVCGCEMMEGRKTPSLVNRIPHLDVKWVEHRVGQRKDKGCYISALAQSYFSDF